MMKKLKMSREIFVKNGSQFFIRS